VDDTGIPNARRWRSYGFRQLAIPAEEFDRIDIAHVTEDGRLSVPTVSSLPAHIEGLLDAWLNVWKAGGAKFVRPPESISLEIPHFEEGDRTVSWREQTISFDPGAFMPFTSVNRETFFEMRTENYLH
jgi:hypothetical protein